MNRAVVALVFAAATACGNPAAPTSTAISHPLFWSIEKDGKTTYLLGTMHVGVDARTKLPERVWHQLDLAPVFAMETDPADPMMAKLAVRTDGGSLHAELGDAYWKKLEIEMTPEVAGRIDHLRPMIAAVMLSLKGIPETEPMDGVLNATALREHKEVVFLEPAARQLGLLDKWMDTRAIKALLDHPTEAHDRAMLDAYLGGDETRMLKLADDERAIARDAGYTDAEYDQEMSDLLYDRNASWIDAIERLHAKNGGFVAVGALHLIGARSVLDLLAHRGYAITRVDP